VVIVPQEVMLASIATKKAIYHENVQTKLALQIVHQKVATNVARKVIFQETVQALHLLSEVEGAEVVEEAVIGQSLEMNPQVMMARVSLQKEDGQIKRVLMPGTIQLTQSNLPMNGETQKLCKSYRNGETIQSRVPKLINGTIKHRLFKLKIGEVNL
jgi:hypothetical protein